LHCSILEWVSTCAVAEHRSDIVSVLPDTPIHHSHDTFIGQSVAEGGSSGNIIPTVVSALTYAPIWITNHLTITDVNLDPMGRGTPNEVSDRNSTIVSTKKTPSI